MKEFAAISDEEINHTMFWVTDAKSEKVIYASPDHEKLWGQSGDAFRANPALRFDVIHEVDRGHIIQVAAQHLDHGYDELYRIIKPAGEICWIRERALPVLSESGAVRCVVHLVDNVTHSVQRQHIDALRVRLVEVVSNKERALFDILARFVVELELAMPQLRGAMLLLDEDGKHMHVAAAPHLPESYVHTVDGMAVESSLDPSSMAVSRNERIIIAHSASGPLNELSKETCFSYGFLACFSEPIRDADGVVLGVLSVYYQTCREPNALELEAVEMTAEMAAEAIQHQRLISAMFRLNKAVDLSDEVVFQLDRNGYIRNLNQAGLHFLGLNKQEVIGQPVMRFLHPESLPVAQQMFAKKTQQRAHETRYELKVVGREGDEHIMDVATVSIIEDGRFAGICGVSRDITSVRKSEMVRRKQAMRMAAERAAITALAINLGQNDVSVERMMQHICEVAAEVSEIERVSIWRFNNQRTELHCLNLFQRESHYHEAGAILKVKDYPSYFDAIEKNRVIVANDARQDADTREFTMSYLIPRNIYSMLDAAIRVEGELFGVVCFEQTQKIRNWSDDEISFAGEIADQVSHALLVEKNRRMTADLELAASVFRESPLGIMIMDEKGLILRVNRAFTEITGYSTEEALGQSPRLLQSGRHDKSYYERLWSCLKKNGQWSGEMWSRRKNGEIYPEWRNVVCVKNTSGKVTHYISSFSDITEKKLSEIQTHRLAYYDSLTNLPNRMMLQDRLEHAIAQARRRNSKVALLFLDLDDFKDINDTMGHSCGDVLLQMIAGDLKACMREEDTVARLGGDEFVAVLADVRNEQDVMSVASKILAEMQQVVPLEGKHVRVSFSIGISIFPDNGDDVETLLKHADIALYRAKKAGRGRYEFFTQEMTIALHERHRLEADLREALEKHQFVLYYQPQIDLKNMQVIGVEALIRWQHPEDGLVSPFKFIPVAEEMGLIIPLGQWIMEEACRQQFLWRKQGVSTRMAVNLSARQLQDANLLKMLVDIKERFAIEAGMVELELTESCLVEEPEESVKLMQQIRHLGFYLAIDDFGTGYSSLSYLKRLSINTLKIDRSFVKDLPLDRQDVAIATTIIAMARNLGLKVLAEGAETAAQVGFLQEHGCDEIQGYYFSKPVPAEEVPALLHKNWRDML